MDTQTRKTQSTQARPAPQKTGDGRQPAGGTAQRKAQPAPEYGRRKGPNQAVMALLRKCMYVVIGGIAIVGLLLIILPMFRVSSLECSGNVRYTAEEILKAAQLEENQELLAVPDDDVIRNRIFDWDTDRYIQSIAIERRFGTISIRITEAQNLMYTEQNGTYYVLDGTLRTMYSTLDASAVCGYTKVTLPVGASFTAGKKVSFPYSSADTAYIGELLSALDEHEIRESITEIDFSKKFGVSYVLENACCVKIGKVGDMETKLALVEEILSRRAVDFQTLSVVDVSNTGNPTYRVLAGSEMLMNR